MKVTIVSLKNALRETSSTKDASRLLDVLDFKSEDCSQVCSIWTDHKKKRRRRRHRREATSFVLGEVMASAKRGCRLCRFLESLLNGLFLTSPEIRPYKSTFKWLSPTFILDVADQELNKNWKFQFFGLKGAKARIIPMLSSSLLIGDTSSTVSLNRVRKVLQDCEASHEACGLRKSTPLPKRILDLKAVHTKDGTQGIKLVETGGQYGIYACLSHCWGDPDLIHSKTTSASIKEYMDFIPWNLLSKTFQDAVEIARSLDIWYIWIDSLCIVQDSRGDWEVESSKMGDVYRNSYITIAAVASTDSRGGCFSKTRPDSCIKIDFEPEEDLSLLIGIRSCDSTWQPRNTSSSNSMSPADANYPLFSRAWVYQERMLSRRVLYCTRSELRVGCRTRLSCECGSPKAAPHLQPPQPSVNIMERLGTLTRIAQERESSEMAAVSQELDQQVFEVWGDIVMAYSKLRLTMKHDKLPALSAGAKLVGAAVKSEYLAGIWKSSLMLGLLWYVHPPKLAPRPEWRAPTWSWASVDAPNGVACVSFGKHTTLDAFKGKIEGAETVKAGVDSTGQVTSGFIRLKAALWWASLRIFCKKCTRTSPHGTLFAIHTLHVLKAIRRGARSCTFSVAGIDVHDAGISYYADTLRQDFDISDIAHNTAGDDVGCKLTPVALLYVPRDPSPQSSSTETISDRFIVLAKCRSQTETYERMGLVMIAHKSAKSREVWFEEVWSKVVSEEKTRTLV